MSVYDNPFPICAGCVEKIDFRTFIETRGLENLESVRSCCPYENPIKKYVLQMKDRNKASIRYFFEHIITQNLDAHPLAFEHFDAIVPIPISRAQLLERGFNQAEILARIVREIIKQPLLAGVLIKTRHTHSQKYLNKKERMENLKRSFGIPDRSAIDGKSILLVDDVITTGSTLEACAETLITNGATKVYGLTLAKTFRRDQIT
ncbi:MAG: ComF family protein [Candidatus Omnitrophica bacterium]|nr:ComF family protein [Candidatus Omnitrophota bacterium]